MLCQDRESLVLVRVRRSCRIVDHQAVTVVPFPVLSCASMTSALNCKLSLAVCLLDSKDASLRFMLSKASLSYGLALC